MIYKPVFLFNEIFTFDSKKLTGFLYLFLSLALSPLLNEQCCIAKFHNSALTSFFLVLLI